MFATVAGLVSQSNGLHSVHQNPVRRQKIGLQNTPTYDSSSSIKLLQRHFLINLKKESKQGLVKKPFQIIHILSDRPQTNLH